MLVGLIRSILRDSQTLMPMPFSDIPASILLGIGLEPFRGMLLRYTYCYEYSRNQPAASPCLGRLFVSGKADASVSTAITLAKVLSTGFDSHGYRCRIVPLIWMVLRTHILGLGCSSLAYLTAAVLLHHVRRTLWPDLGAYVFADLVEQWRLVLARPDIFLEQDLTVASWPCLLTNSMRKWVWDMVAGAGSALFLAAAATENRRKLAAAFQRILFSSADSLLLAHTLLRRAQNVAGVLFLLWLFSCVEYAFMRIFHSGALIYAVIALILGEKGLHRSLFWHILSRHPLSAALLAWSQLIVFPTMAIFPLGLASLHAAIFRRQTGLLFTILGAVGTMYTLLRYRAPLYLAIETSGFFVILAFAGLSSVLVLADALQDRVSLHKKDR